MERLRLSPMENVAALAECCRCQAGEHFWDRICGKAYCPNCQESLVLGESPPLVERSEKKRCVVCNRQGTVRFVTFPLRLRAIVEMDLCSEHLRALLGRKLLPYAYHQLRRQLQSHNLCPDDIFLLHAEFYDRGGRALRPALDPE